LPERLDYLWFLGYSLDDEIPDHSVLSNARKRWGAEVFESLFIRSIQQCMEADLVDNEKIHLDGSHIEANASKDSVLKADPLLMDQLREAYQVQEAKLEAAKGTPKGKVLQNRRLMSTTDPDAPCIRKKSGGESRPRYKAHRVVDDTHGVITATETTPGDVGENQRMKALIEQHQRNVGDTPNTAIADSQYGTAENYRDITAMGISTHVRPFARKKRGQLYGKEKFRYDSKTDTYECPAGQLLYPRSFDKIRWAMEYVVRKGTCNECPLKGECTQAKTGRTVLRRWAQELIDEGIAASETEEAAKDLKRRMWLIEGSFAQAANLHGFKRSRWRRLSRQKIQDWIICTVQNVKILITHAKTPNQAAESVSYLKIGIQQLDTVLNRLLVALTRNLFITIKIT
jgi:IS5 family transposase